MRIEDVDDTLVIGLHELAKRIGVDASTDGWQARTVELAVGFMLGSADRHDRRRALGLVADEHCPTCGGLVAVVSGDEGTSYYRALDADA